MCGLRLQGKNALVTGGGGGIGEVICQVFARQGANVAVMDIRNEAAASTALSLQGSEGQIHFGIQGDVTKPDDVTRVFRTAEEKFGGKCNVLVNCAAIIRNQALFDESSDTDFDDIMNVNLKGPYLMAKEFLRSLKEVDVDVRGSLINISSNCGQTGCVFQTAYSASKFGMNGLTKVISLEFSKHRVRANSVLPGMVQTPLLDALDKSVVDSYVKGVPMGRLATAEEVANACLFLASDESSFINGIFLDVSGGRFSGNPEALK